MNTDRIAYFLAVVREGSFSAAAKNMYVSQTASRLRRWKKKWAARCSTAYPPAQC